MSQPPRKAIEESIEALGGDLLDLWLQIDDPEAQNIVEKFMVITFDLLDYWRQYKKLYPLSFAQHLPITYLDSGLVNIPIKFPMDEE